MDENVPTEADASAPELEATAAIQPEENTTPETPVEQEAPKTFSQEGTPMCRADWCASLGSPPR